MPFIIHTWYLIDFISDYAWYIIRPFSTEIQLEAKSFYKKLALFQMNL